MPLVTFNPGGVIVDVPAHSPLLDAAKKAGISVETPCGGKGVCGKCLVRIESGEVEFNNSGLLTKQMIEDGLVLICKSKVLDVPISVNYFTNIEKEQGKFTQMLDDMLLIDEKLLPTQMDFEAIVKKTMISVNAPVLGDGLADYDRFKKAVLAKFGGRDVEIPISILKLLPNILRKTDGNISMAYYLDYEIVKIVEVEEVDNKKNEETSITSSEEKKNKEINITISNEIDDKGIYKQSEFANGGNFGIAVDIGTTTVAVKLVNMEKGDIVSSKTDYNAQIECGLDVISRINYAQKPQRQEELRLKVLGTINGILKELSITNDIDPKNIYNASIAGNTTMIHLLMGINPEYIRLEPYTPAVYQVPLYKAVELGIEISPEAPIYIAPSVGSYLGGDITSGILCTTLATNSQDICLFIDIGTNGELVLGNEDFLMGCACSAGPAFEGGSIEKGMRASKGAIESVEINEITGIADYSTIGDVPPIGICGSGMISLIASLLKTRWIDAAGKLDRTRVCRAIDTSSKNAKYIIAPSEDCSDGKAIYITESDIDNLIRAKAAIFSACRVMLQSVSMDFEDLTKIYIAGGFGRYLDIEKSKIIGLIPDLPPEKFEFIGNSSMIGAYMTLISKNHRDKQFELSQKITYLDLSTEAGYMDQYTAALFLPHTDSRLFKGVMEELAR